MALIVSVQQDFAFLQNPIPANLYENGANFRRFLYKVTVDSVDSEEYEALRDSDNEAETDISPLLQKYFDIADYALPDLTNTNIQILNNQTSIIKSYTLTVKSQFMVGAEQTDIQSKYVVWGGLSYKRKKTDTTLTKSASNTYPYLYFTNEKNTTPTGKEFFTFANIFLTDFPTAFVLEYIFKDEAGITTHTGTISTLLVLQINKTSLFDLSYSKIVTPITTAKIYSYQLRIRATAAATPYVGPYITFTVNHNYQTQTTAFLYLNQMGGLSTIRLTGQRIDKHAFMREKTTRYLAPSANLPASRHYSRLNDQQESFKIGTGYYENWEQFAQVRDFCGAQAIWEIVGTELLPVELTSKDIQTNSTDQIELAFDELEFNYLMTRYD